MLKSLQQIGVPHLNAYQLIPFATEQSAIALRVLDQMARPLRRVADLGCGDGAIAEMRQILASLTSTPELAAS